MIRSIRNLLGAALAGVTLTCAAAQTCNKPLPFPSDALKNGDAGISLVAFLVRADGTVARSVVLDSSGSADLDRETQVALARCPFKPLSLPDGPAEYWTPVAYTWALDDDPGMVKPKQEAANAARAGDPGALFRLSRVLAHTAKTDADRRRALTVLRGAAAKGNAPAQYALGRRYETGDGVEKDLDQAMQWYDLAAKQGDVLAVQRLRLGVLTD
jgi:TonB family protein